MTTCKTLGCEHVIGQIADDFCEICLRNTPGPSRIESPQGELSANDPQDPSVTSTDHEGEHLQVKYPDVYAVHHVFEISDPSGAIHHASRILLLCSMPDNRPSQSTQIRKARDLLNRWLNLNTGSTE